jgi:hypothetical protein
MEFGPQFYIGPALDLILDPIFDLNQTEND